jgi:hypothetical protein
VTFDLGNIYDELMVANLFSRQLIGVSLMNTLISEYCQVAMGSVEVPTYQGHLFRSVLRSQQVKLWLYTEELEIRYVVEVVVKVGHYCHSYIGRDQPKSHGLNVP